MLALTKLLPLVLVLFLPLACTQLPPGWTMRKDLCCIEKTDGEAACRAKPGCYYGQELICMGKPPPPEMKQEMRKTREECQLRCACICPEDEKRCRETP